MVLNCFQTDHNSGSDWMFLLCMPVGRASGNFLIPSVFLDFQWAMPKSPSSMLIRGLLISGRVLVNICRNLLLQHDWSNNTRSGTYNNSRWVRLGNVGSEKCSRQVSQWKLSDKVSQTTFPVIKWFYEDNSCRNTQYNEPELRIFSYLISDLPALPYNADARWSIAVIQNLGSHQFPNPRERSANKQLILVQW